MMEFSEFKAEAERLGLEAHDYRADLWMLCAPYKAAGARLVFNRRNSRGGWIGEFHGTPADAIREASRLLRPDVAGELRKWANRMVETTEGLVAFARQAGGSYANQSKALDGVRKTFLDVLAKLDELEGKRC